MSSLSISFRSPFAERWIGRRAIAVVATAAALVSGTCWSQGAGQLDPTFGLDGKTTVLIDAGGDLTDGALAVAVQPDGKLVVAGVADSGPDNQDMAIARLDSNGTLDPGFGSFGTTTVPFDMGGDLTESVNDLAIQPDGKIVLVGSASCGPAGGADRDFAIARLNSNGSLDSSFSIDGRQPVSIDLGGSNRDFATSVALQDDGKIVVAGWADRSSPGDTDFAVVRLHPDGSLDTSFDFDGIAVIPFDNGGDYGDTATAVNIQPDGKIVVTGVAAASGTWDDDFAAARLNANGSLDTTFDFDGRTSVAFDLGDDNWDYASDAVLQSDGKIVLAGHVDTATGGLDFGAIRLLSTGALDTSFGIQGRITVAFDADPTATVDYCYGVDLQTDGKIVLAGEASVGGRNTDFGIARLTADGILDTTFGTAGKTLVAFDHGQDHKDSCRAVALQHDSKVVCVGAVEQPTPGDSDFAIVRLTSDVETLFADGFEGGGTDAWDSVAP